MPVYPETPEDDEDVATPKEIRAFIDRVGDAVLRTTIRQGLQQLAREHPAAQFATWGDYEKYGDAFIDITPPTPHKEGE